MDVAAIADGVLTGDRRAVARAISMVEDGVEGLPELSARLFPRTGGAYVLGLTGAPGAGKSSLTQCLIATARQRDLSVAVLAIDPTSPFTGGALLGDRLRMQAHATDPGVFIRSMATRGHLGGLALAVPEAVRILDAAGRDLVIVETVGVGQVEVEIAHAADTTLVVVNPGWGDAIQVAKAGILEIADVYVVNKADREGADRTVRDLEVMVGMGSQDGWRPPVVRTSALKDEGVADLWSAVEAHRAHLEEGTGLIDRRRDRLVAEVQDMAAQSLAGRVASALNADGGLVAALQERTVDPYAATADLVARALGEPT